MLCRLFGHRWRYKDYHYAIRANGQRYPFINTRVCNRCGRKEVRRNYASGWSVYPIGFRLEEFSTRAHPPKEVQDRA